MVLINPLNDLCYIKTKQECRCYLVLKHYKKNFIMQACSGVPHAPGKEYEHIIRRK